MHHFADRDIRYVFRFFGGATLWWDVCVGLRFRGFVLLPRIGFIAWPDMVGFVQRLRLAFPQQHLLVDIDDGYVDPEVACHAVEHLERIGATGVILEDHKPTPLRPRQRQANPAYRGVLGEAEPGAVDEV